MRTTCPKATTLGGSGTTMLTYCDFVYAGESARFQLPFVNLGLVPEFGSTFSLQNTLQRASPLFLAALCVALPAQLGLIVIGGEGAIVLGGLAAAAVAPLMSGLPPIGVQIGMASAGCAIGAMWIGLIGLMRARRSQPGAASPPR